MDIQNIVDESIKYAKKMSKYVSKSIYYTYKDVSILPTILTKVRSRSQVNTKGKFITLDNSEIQLLPAFGAAQKYMRVKFAKSIYEGGAISTLPRVGLTEEERIQDVRDLQTSVGAAIGYKDSDKILDILLSESHLKFLSIDVAHGASIMTIEMLQRLRERGIKNGVMVGTTGSVYANAFLYKAMDMMGIENKIIRVGVGAGASCATRVNTGVGVGLFTLIDDTYNWIKGEKLTDIKTIADGGARQTGDLAKALTRSDGIMTGKMFASESFEDDHIVEIDGMKYARYYGMASHVVKGDHKHVEGGETYQPFIAQTAKDICEKLTDGLSSAMTYTDSSTLEEFKENSIVTINSIGSIKEAPPH